MSNCNILLILWIIFFETVPAIAKKAKKPASVAEAEYYDGGRNSLESGPWRFSLDGKYYSLALSGGLRIIPVRSGHFGADVPRKTSKKGRITFEGQWRAEGYTGLLVIQDMRRASISGHMLLPTAGAGFSVCNSRKSAVLFSLGQPQPVCNFVSVSWTLEPNLPEVTLANAETAQDLLAAYSADSQSVSSSNAIASSFDNSLAGVWSNESATAVSYENTRLVLNTDGTYMKTFGARPPTMGGGVVGAPTWGVTHHGTWSVVGSMRVRLSGDSQHTPYVQDLRLLVRQ